MFFGLDDVIDDVTNTKNYTLLPANRIHIWVKYEVDWSNGATCIASSTDRQTNKQTNGQTNILAKIENFGK